MLVMADAQDGLSGVEIEFSMDDGENSSQVDGAGTDTETTQTPIVASAGSGAPIQGMPFRRRLSKASAHLFRKYHAIRSSNYLDTLGSEEYLLITLRLAFNLLEPMRMRRMTRMTFKVVMGVQ